MSSENSEDGEHELWKGPARVRFISKRSTSSWLRLSDHGKNFVRSNTYVFEAIYSIDHAKLSRIRCQQMLSYPFRNPG